MAGLVQRVKSAFNYIWNAAEMEYTPLLATGPGMFYGGGAINWGLNYWKDGYYDNEVVYQSLRVYLKKAKVAPIMLSKIVDEKQLIKYEQFIASAKNQEHRVIALKTRAKALNEIEEHSILNLFSTPNTYQTRSELFEAWFGNWKLSGNGYLWGYGDPEIGVNKGKFKELHVIPSYMCTPIYSGDFRNPIHHYELFLDGETLNVDPSKICHLKDWNPANNWNGLSPTVPGKKVIKTDGFNKLAQAKSFENGGKAYMISSDSDDPDGGYTVEQAQLVDEKIRQKLAGAHNYGNIFSITRKTKVQAIGDSAADMKLIEAANANRSSISNLFGVDSVLIGDKTSATESFVISARKSLVTDTIVPDLIEAREHLSKWLLPSYPGKKLYLEFDTTVYAELQPDLKLLQTVYGTPALSVNEKRNLFNYDSLDDDKLGSLILVASGQETLESFTQTPDNADEQVNEALKQWM
jgi:HK97 family phage portal protein